MLLAGTILLVSLYVRAEQMEPSRALTHSVIQIEVDVIKREQNQPRHHLERCSGALIQRQGVIRILSAWHCFDGYENLATPPRVRFKGQLATARLLNTGGSMANDWALLALTTSLEGVVPLPLGKDLDRAIRMGGQAAGYPRAAVVDSQPILQLSAKCGVIGRFKGWWSTHCQAIEGMSGGPFITVGPEGPVLSGVVSARDAQGHVLITPLPYFLLVGR